MKTVLPREQAVEDIFSKILASPEASRRLREVFYQYLDDEHMLVDEDPDHFLQVLFHASQENSMERQERIRSFLPMWKGSFLKMLERWFPPMTMENLRKPLTGMNAYQDPDFIWQMDMTLYALTRMDWKLKRKKKSASVGF